MTLIKKFLITFSAKIPSKNNLRWVWDIAHIPFFETHDTVISREVAIGEPLKEAGRQIFVLSSYISHCCRFDKRRNF